MQNETLIKACRQILKDLLLQCSPPQQLLFKRMYGDDKRAAAEMTVNEVVDKMDPKKIDWAVTQAEKTIKDNEDKLVEKYK